MNPYSVTITREGDNWLADVEGVSGAHTFGRSLESLLRSVREVVILMDDLPDDAEVAFRCRYDVEDGLVKAAAELGELRRQLAAQEAALVERTAGMARDLVAHHVSMRDTAALLDITPGRVSQLAKAAKL